MPAQFWAVPAGTGGGVKVIAVFVLASALVAHVIESLLYCTMLALLMADNSQPPLEALMCQK